MGVTFNQIPQAYTPSDNPIAYAFSYDNYTFEYNHVFKISVTLDSVLIGVFDYFPIVNEFNYYTGYIDVSNIVKTHLDKANTNQTGIKSDAANYGLLSVNANCWYSLNPNDAATDQLEQSTAANVYPFKACLSNKEFVNWNYGDYTMGGSSRKFLTDNTNIVELREGDETFLQIISDTISSNIETKLYDSTGTLIATNSTSMSGYRISQLKYSTTILSTIFTPTQVLNASYFTAQIKSAGGFVYSELKRININREGCFNGKNLVWLNKFGAYDTFLFTYNNILKSDIQSKSYGKRFGSFNGTTYDFNTKDTGSLTYLKTITDKIQIVSDWLSQVEQNFVVQVYESPLVYINEGTLYENIEIENSSYQFKQAEHEELFNEIIDAKFTHSRKSINI